MIKALTAVATSSSPTPASMPMAEVAQIEAAVVSPRTPPRSCRIIPPPRKPTPVTTPAMTFSAVAGKFSTPTAVNAAAPRVTRQRCDHRPPSHEIRAPSPTAKASKAATAIRSSVKSTRLRDVPMASDGEAETEGSAADVTTRGLLYAGGGTRTIR